jgi:hypothetical protein
MECDVKPIIDMCIHDVKNCDMKEYKYYIIAKKDNETFIEERLNDILIKINQNGGLYNKYLRNKSNYLAL